MNKLSTGSLIFDKLLDGGYNSETLTTIYGPSSTGKTCLAMLASIAAINNHKKVIYLDTERNFSIERFKQLNEEWENHLKKIILFKINSFEEQEITLKKLVNFVNDLFGLVVVDNISTFYRLQLAKEDYNQVNVQLNEQLNCLSEIAHQLKIPILILNQIYLDFKEKNKVNLIGGDILRRRSKCLIEVRKNKNDNEAILRKHSHLSERSVKYQIVREGIISAE